jgi:hypothetical protein
MSSVTSVRAPGPPTWPPAQRDAVQRENRARQSTAPPASDIGRAATSVAPASQPETLRNQQIARATKPDPEGRPAQEQAGLQALQAAGRNATYGSTQAAPPRRLRIEA